MTRTMPILAIGAAAMALAICNAAAGFRQASAAEAVSFDEGSSRRKGHPRAHTDWEIYVVPRACSSVKFPRSPLCAPVPPAFSPYGIDFPRVFF